MYIVQAGDRWKVDCNECECKYGGEVVCERKVCNKACRDHNGYTHQVGDRFLSG